MSAGIIRSSRHGRCAKNLCIPTRSSSRLRNGMNSDSCSGEPDVHEQSRFVLQEAVKGGRAFV